MNAIIELLNAIFSGGTISASAVIVLVIAFLIYKIAGKHIDELYSNIRQKKSNEHKISVLKSDLISSLQRNKEVEEMLIKYIDLSNRQKVQIMHLKAQLSERNEWSS